MSFLKISASLAIMAMLALSCGKPSSPQIESIMLDRHDVVMAEGEETVLSVTVSPDDAVIESLYWSSSNTDIAVVSDGKVTAVKEGEAVITVSASGMSDQCRITVKSLGGQDEPESITLDPSEAVLEPGETIMINAIVLPEGCGMVPEWTSDDSAIAKVTDGTVTAVAEGETYIHATVAGLSASCRITVVSGELPSPSQGDFYYSDGTYSSVLDHSKTPVGIVFWTGDPTTDDPALAKDHPECTNGLVLALRSGGDCAWQTGDESYGNTVSSWIEENASQYITVQSSTDGSGDDNLNRILGYNNTMAIELFNADPANSEWTVDAVVRTLEHREIVPAPASSSGWYLPSAKELSLMCSGEFEGNIWDISQKMTGIKDMLNERLKEIPSADLLGYGAYWSSTERDASDAFFVSFVNGYVNTVFKHYGKYGVRFILAF